MSHSTEKIEFGDFQTPNGLADECCKAIARDFGKFSVVVEPTCGIGSFVQAAANAIQPAEIYANEVNREYLEVARNDTKLSREINVTWTGEDFFRTDWRSVRDLFQNQPTLFVGNPPWVTNSQLGSLGSANVPTKRNFDGVSGIQAVTGHGNFDISEYILREIIQCMRPGLDAFAFLVKTATARKVVRYAWNNDKNFAPLTFYEIDAKREFGVSVDAVLIAGRLNATELSPTTTTHTCMASESVNVPPRTTAMGWVNQKIVSDPYTAKATQHLAYGQKGVWRSGVKHDASKVLELRCTDGVLVNGLKERVEIEANLLYPLMKGSDVANGRKPNGKKFVLVPQHATNEDTGKLACQVPLSYAYLKQHEALFAKRKSSIYRKRDRFAIFGVGPYTFRPWKVAICGLYKRLQFSVYGPHQERPVVFDDTVYFVGTDNEEQSHLLHRILSSKCATAFLESRVFWDSKRPITIELLQSLNLHAVACEICQHRQWDQLDMDGLLSQNQGRHKQPQMF